MTDLSNEAFTRFVSKFKMGDGCWEWQAGRFIKGYGQFSLNGQGVGAHVASHLFFIGEVPEGLEVHHKCVNPPCVRPGHLKAVTPEENKRMSGAIAAMTAQRLARTHCPQGHEYSEENTYVNQGRRNCIICKKASARKSYLKLKGSK